MALPQLPADGLNPWGSALRSVLTDISNRADQGITDAANAQADVNAVGDIVDEHDVDITAHGTRLDTLETTVDTKANDNIVVKTSGNQNITGTKTFASAPVVPDNSFAISKVNGLQTALNSKVNSNNPSFTGTITGIDRADVGLANVNNTTDADKPISTATQAALNLKANTSDLTSRIQTHNHTGGVNGVHIPIGGVAGLQSALNSKEDNMPAQATGAGAVTWDAGDYDINYFNMVRWGRVVFVTIAFTTKYGIGNNSVTGNTSNKTVVTIKPDAPWGDIWRGPSNGHYSSMTYPMSSGADGAVISGYLDASDRQIKLAATVPYNFNPGYTFSLNGIYFLNAGA